MGPHRGGSLLARRCSAQGSRGVVSAAAPEAALVGRDVLRSGGNAFDAAVATALAETVLLPSKCGLGGELVALVKKPHEDLVAVLAIGTAPVRLSEALTDGRHLPTTGGLSAGVPAAPHGYAELAAHGRLPLVDLVAPAIGLAREGFSWSPLTQDYSTRALDALLRENPGGTSYLPDDRPIPAGRWVRLPRLATLLEAFAEHGADLFMAEPGRHVVNAVRARGGVIEAEDLAAQRAETAAPVETTLAGVHLWATPAPTHGPALLEALASAHADGEGTPRRQVEAVLEVKARQAREIGDAAPAGGTSIVTAADAEGNSVVVVHSNSHPTFGSCVVVPEYDLVLGNRAGRGFTNEPGHPNAPAPGRRPVTTLHAWALAPTDRTPLTLGATSGGEQQMPWNVQVVDRLLRGRPPAEAVHEPLWSIDASSGAVRHEDDGDLPDLGDRRVTRVEPLSMQSGIQVVRTADRSGTCSAVSDIRSVGGAVAL